MLLALRKGPPTDATGWQRFVCAVIKARLASDYCHGGIVIDGALYHATSARGLHRLGAGEWTPKNWDLIDVGGDDEAALSIFRQHEGAPYDWLSLLAFVGLRVRDSERMYCFEWCWLAITGEQPRARVTPETLLLLSLRAAV
jgi:hypothetical protein